MDGFFQKVIQGFKHYHITIILFLWCLLMDEKHFLPDWLKVRGTEQKTLLLQFLIAIYTFQFSLTTNIVDREICVK